MRLRLSLLFLLLFKANNFILGLNTHKIIIEKQLKTLIINEGDELIIKCNNTNTFSIAYPETDTFNGITTSKQEIIFQRTVESDNEWLFRRKKTVFGDTGWYKCIDNSFYPSPLLDDPALWGVYVYVQSPNNLFVQTRQNNSLFFVPVDQSILHLPCRPTIPTMLVDIIDITSNTNRPLNKSIAAYNSTNGFRIKNWDSGSYKCRIDKNVSISEIFYNIKAINKTFLLPIIDKSSIKHVIKRQTLHVYCYFKISEISESVIWITPQDPDSRKIKNNPSLRKVRDTVSELIVENVTFNDMGLYSCKLEGFTDTYAAAAFIRVYDVVEINCPEEVIKDEDVILECISWFGNITESVQWLNEKNESLQTNETIDDSSVANTLAKRAFLYLRNIQKLDSGEYTCRVNFIDNTTKIVRQKIVVKEPQAPYFFGKTLLNKRVYTVVTDQINFLVLRCYAGGVPKPKITWYNNHVPIDYRKKVRKAPPPEILFDIGLPISEEVVMLLLYKLRDDVNFSCIAKNRYGQVENFAIFRVVKGQAYTFPIWILAIVGFIILIIICMIYICIKIQYQKVKEKALEEIGLSSFNKGNLRILHLNLTMDEQAEYLLYDKNWEFKRKNLKLGKQLGSGAFGIVVKAEAKNISAEEKKSIVAVKIVSRVAEPIYMNAIAKELKILAYVGKHLNILNLLGTCTDNIAKKELLLIMEYCCFGNLYNYLFKNRNEFINQIDPSTGKIDSSIHRITSSSIDLCDEDDVDSENANCCQLEPGWRSNYYGDYNDEDLETICTKDLMFWSFQIACGMEFLHQKNVVHGDLAAKNILLTKNNVVKICDFGLARTIYANENSRNFESFPVKWMAIESIRYGRFTLQSDIWSFAVVLWELFSLSETPYSDILRKDLCEKLMNGYRLAKPKYAIDEIYQIMSECWKGSPNERPASGVLVEKIGELLDEVAKMHYAKLNGSYAEKHVKFTKDEVTSISDKEDDSTSRSISNIFSEEVPDEIEE